MNNLDEFQRSALAYQKLVENKIRYRIEFFAERPLDIAVGSEKTAEEIHLQGNTVNTFEIIFTPDEFKHLSSVHKLKDIDDSSKTLYEKAVNISGKGKRFNMNNIRESNYFFDDTDKSQNPETIDMTDEEFQETVEKTKNKHFLSKILSRLDALENLYSTIEQSGLDENSNKPLELKIYVWDRKASNSERPHNSDIKANFLIECYDKNNSVKPYTDFFIVLAEDGTYRGMSVFHSEYSYACDDKGRKVDKVTALSLETLKKEKSISIVSADIRIIEQCKKRERKHNENIEKEAGKNLNKDLIEKYLDKISYHRSELITSLTKRETEIKKNINNPKTTKKISKNQEYYHSFAETFLFDELSINDMSEIIDRLSRTLSDTDAGSTKWKCINYEIKTMDSRIALKKMISELEQLLNQEDFSIDAYADKLSAVSAYLADRNVNVGRDLVLKVAGIIEQQKENCDEFTAELIDDEVKKIKRTAEQKSEYRISFGQSGRFRTAQFHISQFAAQDNAMSLTMPFEAVLNSLAESFNQLQESVIEKIHGFANKVRQTADRIMNTVSATFHRKQEQDTEEPSVSAPETENENTENKDSEKDSNNDSHYIIMDGAGIQSYGSYVTIVSASELDFQVPLTYEIQQKHEKQQVEQEVSEEKSPAPEHRKKQAEYDDF